MILIKPSIHIESQSPLITPFIYNTFPTSLGFLAGYLREYNKIVPKIFDEQIQPLDRKKIEQLLAEDRGPKIVGMTIVTINSYRAYTLAKMIKEIDSDYLIVLGGIHASVLPEECLSNPEIDIAVRGEGEETLSELTRCIQTGKSYTELDGISFRMEGKPRHNPPRPLLDIDKIPCFPYDLFDSTFSHYRDFGTVISSRGCPFDCIFCSQRAITGRKYRYIPNEKVLNDIDILINRYKQTKIWFMDDNFLADKKRVFSLLNGILKSGFNKKACFCAEMRGESATYEIFAKMKEANFAVVSFGMETASQRLLDLIDKREKVADNVNAIKLAHKLGLSSSATFIFGLPTETKAERLKTARLARKIPLDDARFNVAVPYPGTRLFEIARKENRLFVKPHWSNFNVQCYMFSNDIPYVPENVNKYQLIYDTFMANLRFNIRLKIIINLMKAPISGGMVLTLPRKWCLSYREIGKLTLLMLFLLKRSIKICAMRYARTSKLFVK